MKSKFLNSIMFISVIICLIISLRLFWNIGIFSDEYSSSPGAVLGGDFWLYMSWLRLLLITIVFFLSVINIFPIKKTALYLR